jgi:hypothetical protein
MKSSVFALAAYGAAADQGEDIQCIAGRAHKVVYEHDGATLEDVTDATIEVTRYPDGDAECASSNGGDKPFCIGVNVDDSCEHNAGILPINDIFECKNCFGGAETDLYYKFEHKFLKLQKVEVGLTNTKIKGALEVHGHKDAAADIISGSIAVPDKEFSFSFKAGIIPVDLKFKFPTTLKYDLGLEGHLDAVAGADLDIDFGEHHLTWTPDDGFVMTNTEPTVSLSPVITVDDGDSGADITMGIESSLQVDVDKVVWYHVNLTPTFPSKLSFETHWFKNNKICLKGDMDFPITHEGEVYHTLLGHDVVIKHFGPAELSHLQKQGLIDKCIDLSADVTV